jgi:hypothetical protein
MKKINYFLLLGAIFIFSCKKKVEDQKKIEEVANVVTGGVGSQELVTLANYYDVLTKKTNAVFGVSLSTQIFDVDNVNAPYVFGGTFIGDNGTFVKGGTVSFGGYNFLPTVDNNYDNTVKLSKSITGKMGTISFQKPISLAGVNLNPGLGKIVSKGFYIPKPVKILTPVRSPNWEVEPEVRANDLFTWETDPGNGSMGMIVAVEYNPDHFDNKAFKAAYPQKIRYGMVTADNGSFNIPASFFVNIPVGCIVEVAFGRANYLISTDVDNNTSTLFAYHYKHGGFRYKN